jgi:hypothetical protein
VSFFVAKSYKNCREFLRSVLNYGKMQLISGDFGEEGFLEIVSENAAVFPDAGSCGWL